ncbi:MAG TPA: Calx-beta domain-containing protein, partial [Verrucomicrobiae bacterium]|nr:Calx-beta domain-containing protein [Verrucomicrobiae bacterium]
FYANENKIGESILSFVVAPDDGTPITHEFHWNGVPAGQYTLTARATDDQGGVRTSPPIRISVNESNPPTRTVVSITATDAEGREIAEVPPGMGMPQLNDPAIFTVSRTGSVSNALTVYYTVGGTAMNGVDYVELSGQVEIPAGQRSAEIEVDVIDDRLVEGTETVRIQVVPPVCPAIEPPPPECYIVGGQINNGAVLTFDDVDPGNDGLPGPECVPVPNGYGGLSWNYFDVINGLLLQPDYGYHRGTISPSNVVFNIAGEPATIRSLNGTFDLGSAYLTSALNIEEPMTVQVIGLMAGSVVYDNKFTLTRTPILAQFNYRGIDEARFISSPPRQFAMDNLAIGVGSPSVAEARIFDNDMVPVPSNRPPVISIVQPTNGAVFLAPADIEIIASAFDSDGYVQTVEFYAGTNRIGTATNNPFSAGAMNPFHIRWSNVPSGEYILTAVATDDRGAQSRSAPVRIAVLGVQPPIPPTVVNIRAVDPEAAEHDPRLEIPENPAVLRVTRSGATDYDLQVRYRLGGTASNGVDYARLSGELVIPTGSESADIFIEVIDDKLVERTESVVVSIVPPICVAIYPPPPGCYTVGPAGTATAFILDDEPFETNAAPRVEITRPAGGATFRAPADIHIVARTVDLDGYVGKVEFFANDHKIGEASKQFLVTPTNGSPIEYEIDWNGVAPGQYALTARAIDNRGAVGVSAPVRISVTGTNEPPPPNVAVVTVYAIDGYASEGGLITATKETYGTNVSRPYTNVAVFEIRRSGGNTDNPLRVFYEMHGTATEGVDYLDLPEVAEIPAGQRSARIVIVPIDDQLAENLESAIICLRPSPLANLLSDYVVGQPGQAGAVIADNDTPPVRCIALSDGVFHLCQPAADGQCFRIEGSTDLQQWTVLGTVAALDGAVRYVDPQGLAYERRFYRAIPVPCPTEQP